MRRLNNRAFDILLKELDSCSTNDQLSQAEKKIVLKRLQQLRQQDGSPASLEEIREAIVDLFPHFNEKVLKQAAKANQPPGLFSKLKWTAIFLAGSAGVVWVANLPYPMIRWPVARTAPILLLPSYMSMDYHYRQAIAQVEQADQLVNHATSPADFELGAKKVKAAQKHLDALPVWFLGYWPRYTFWFGWQFTLDEFKTARATVGRMDAQLFQEKNAQTQLIQAEQALNTAKQQYQKAQTIAEKQQANASWQAALDKLEQIPPETLAGKQAKTRLKADARDFDKVGGSTLIAAAQEFALQAEKVGENPNLEWEQVQALWQEAINRLKQVSLQDPSYGEAQKLLAEYQTNLGLAQAKRKAPDSSNSDKLITAAKQFAFAAAKAGLNPPHTASEWQQVIQLWQQAIDQLQKIQVQDSTYVEAQKLLATYQTNLGTIQTRMQAEQDAVNALQAAKQAIQQFTASPPSDLNQWNSQLQGIINQLETVKAGTTSYQEAQQLRQFAQKRVKQ
ncbi:hypothetical protein [Allocoleopsis sp.]|uniref:hypothetical protein n=1 Tax=Allocoleopsis sp. TaxID=3088169 RepID=UPI002FD55E79